MKEQPQLNVNALISLLDDPDREVYEHVADKLTSLGKEVIPSLENAWESCFDSDQQSRIENLIHKIQLISLAGDISDWSRNHSDDILKGAFLSARYQYPDLELHQIQKKLDAIRREIWLELNYNLTPLEQVNVFNQVFYSIHGFTAKSTNLQDPQNMFINYVLDSKKGNAVSLGIIYLILARQLDMPVYGINLPRHFVLAYCKNFLTEEDLKKDLRDSVMFYINPLNKGTIFSRNEIKLYLRKINIEPKTGYFVPCSTKAVIHLLFKNLMYIYESIGSLEKAAELKELIEVLEDNK